VTQRLTAEQPNGPNAVKLTGIYHNLLRRWAEV
jgi:PKHD-type hydroxylase